MHGLACVGERVGQARAISVPSISKSRETVVDEKSQATIGWRPTPQTQSSSYFSPFAVQYLSRLIDKMDASTSNSASDCFDLTPNNSIMYRWLHLAVRHGPSRYQSAQHPAGPGKRGPTRCQQHKWGRSVSNNRAIFFFFLLIFVTVI